MRVRRTRLAAVGTAAALALGAGLVPQATAAPTGTARSDKAERTTLMRYAEDTWASFVAMTDERTGLPADNIEGDLDPASRSSYTSPTNIGGYLWSTVVARELDMISAGEARQRMARTLETVSGLERHDASGMFYNWYHPATGEKLTTWPLSGDPVHPFLSSVDNGWLAAALRVVSEAEPSLAARAEAVYDEMDFGFYYDPDARPDAGVGLIRGGFWDEEPPGCSIEDNYRDRGDDVFFTCHHYGAFNSEPRIASYIGIAEGQIPAEHYFGAWRTFPATCDWSWTEQMATGEQREYLGVPVFEGAYSYRGMKIVPTWGGSMFEALMPDLFVPEAQWGPRSWGVNHPLFVQAQIEHGLEEADYGYWGFSPSSDPFAEYREYGVEALGMDPDGYASDREKTHVDYGYGECREAQPEPESYGDGVVTPHAAFLALPYAPREALDNLGRIDTELGAYGDGGFKDAVAVRSGTIADRYLSLDQAMVMAAIGNRLNKDVVKKHFVDADLERALRPLMEMEQFGAAPREENP
jgi:hypothetical protein